MLVNLIWTNVILSVFFWDKSEEVLSHGWDCESLSKLIFLTQVKDLLPNYNDDLGFQSD